MLTVLTMTGERPEAFALCQKWMQRQTLEDVTWVIVDDGREPQNLTIDRPDWEIIVLRPKPYWQPGQNTQARNILVSKDFVGDRLAIVEDDDWYAPDWLETLDSALNDADLVGEINAKYYNVKTKTARKLPNKNHASLCATGMKGQGINSLWAAALMNSQFIDIDLWNCEVSKKFLDTSKVIGIKGLPGRPGIGMGHKYDFHGQKDKTGEILKSWIGDDWLVYF